MQAILIFAFTTGLSDCPLALFTIVVLIIGPKFISAASPASIELDAAPGIYILELSAKGEKQQFKLIKQ